MDKALEKKLIIGEAIYEACYQEMKQILMYLFTG